MKTAGQYPTYYQTVQDWFQSLDEPVQRLVLQWIKRGSEVFFEYVEQLHPGVLPALTSLQEFLDEELREHPCEPVYKHLRGQGLEETLVDALILQTLRDLRIYHDAQVLRQANAAEFERITGTILNDVYVKRRYRTLNRLQECLEMYDEETTKKAFLVVRNLLQNVFVEGVSFEELEEFMRDELKLEGEKIGVFLRLLEDEREAVERYFLFEQLAEIRKHLQKD